MASSQSFSMIHWRMLLSPLPASPVNSGEPLKTMPMRLPPSSGGRILDSMCWRNSSEPSLMRGRPAPKRPLVAERIALALDEPLLLLPLHAERRIGEHVVERPAAASRVAIEAVLGEGVAEHDVVGVLALDQHVGLADRPGLIVPVLAEEVRAGVGVQLTDVLLGDREHAAGAAGRVVDGLDHVAARAGPAPARAAG